MKKSKFYKLVGSGYHCYTQGLVYHETSTGDNCESVHSVGYLALINPSSWLEVEFPESKFYVGQKILCVDPIGYLVADMIYTVKDSAVDDTGVVGVNVEECVNLRNFKVGYNESRFIPYTMDFVLDYSDMMTLDAMIDFCYENNYIQDNIKILEDSVSAQIKSQL